MDFAQKFSGQLLHRAQFHQVALALQGQIIGPAVERRQKIAHGASRGLAKQTDQAPAGAKEAKAVKLFGLSPRPGLVILGT
jgi:hypothetical protein